jgi:hypothetical protein
MNIAGDLIALEEQFWKRDVDFNRQWLTAEALMVFPDRCVHFASATLA